MMRRGIVCTTHARTHLLHNQNICLPSEDLTGFPNPLSPSTFSSVVYVAIWTSVAVTIAIER